MQDNNAKVAPGMYVELGYDLYEIAPDGTQVTVHQTNADEPECIIFGVTEGVLEPLEKALDGLQVGETFDVTVTSDKAFGPYDKEKVVDLDREIFVVDGKFDSETVKVGAAVPMMTSEGYRIMGRVLNISGDKVTMDFNHPLAGRDVRFCGKVLNVRPATEEELHPVHHCGCGCDHGHDDCGCGDDHCGCGDDCDCDHEGHRGPGSSCDCGSCH